AYRLICAQKHATLRAVAPYMARTLPREPVGDEVLVRLFPAGLADKLKSEPADDDWGALFSKLAVQAIDEMQSFSIGASVGAEPVQAAVRETLRSADSPLTRILTAQVDVKAPPPDLFWRLPADALGAVYSVGARGEDLAAMKTLFLDTFVKSVREQGVSDEAVARGKKAMEAILLTGGPVSMAYGLDLPAALAAIGAETPGHRADRRVFHGWFAVGVQEPAARWIDAIREINAADRMPKKKVEPGAGAGAGKEKDAEKKKDDVTTVATEGKVGDPQLASRATHFVFSDFPRKDGKLATKPASVDHLFVVADGDRTW